MLKLTIFVICFCAGTLLAKPALDETAAKKFIVESSDKFSELYNNVAKMVFDLSAVVSDDDDESNEKTETKTDVSKSSEEEDWTSDEITGFFAFFLLLAKFGKLQEATENITTLSDEAYRFPVDQFTDEEVKIGILNLKTIPGLLALGEPYQEWSEDDFDDYLEKKNFCEFKKEDKKCKTKRTKFSKVLKDSENPEEILHYWKEWRERNLPEVTKKMTTFINLYKKLGEKLNKSAKFAWYGDYLDENFGDDMEKVTSDLEPLYKELHAYVRHFLHEKYGDVVPATGLIPHHLYEQAMAQAWKPNSVVAKEFAGVKMPIENNFKESAKEVVQIASNFMKSLGLSDLPADFWTKRVREDTENSDDECIADIFDGGNTTYFKYCKEVNIRRFLQMHGYLARVYSDNEAKNVPFAYADSYNLELATGEAVILSATTPKYLHTIGHKNVDVLPEDEDMNRLFRMGVHTLLSVPEYFVNSKVVADVLDNKVPLTEMNKHYWELMKKYLGVAPPVERTAEAMDFPQKFYSQIEHNQQAVKFGTEVIGYQIYESLCTKSGEFIKNDKTHLLHNCNFYNSKEAGKTLKSMMELGSKKPWKQILGQVTGNDNGMTASAMLEYFEPLQKWLHTKNTEHKTTVGW